MRNVLIAAALLLPTAASAISADDIAVTVVSVRPRGPFADVLYSVQNRSSARLEVSELSCSVFDASGALIGVNSTVIRNLKAGETGANTTLVTVPKESLASASKATCRVIDAR